MYSTPTPAVQPTFVCFCSKEAPNPEFNPDPIRLAALFLCPNAAPPVTYNSAESNARPARPRIVASQFTSNELVKLAPPPLISGRNWLVLAPIQLQSPSTP